MNIGLIALSGIRARDPELLAAGMTFPGFLERSKVIASLPSLGLLTIAALTPAGHDVSYMEVRDLPPSDEDLPRFDLVALSTFTAQAFEAYELADRYRARGTLVVMGGLHVTSCPAEALEHCDAVVCGEGELAWATVVEDAMAGRLQPIYDTRAGSFDLAHAPVPAYHLLEIPNYNRLTVQTSRGCPWRCEFCASSILISERYKQKPIERVLSEIDAVRAIWPRPFIEFADDNSFVNKAYWKRLLPELETRQLRWFTETDISVADDEDLLELMFMSGCKEVLIGLESPEAGGLSGVELRRDCKPRRLPGYARAIDRIQRHGIRVNTCFVLGFDGQPPDVFRMVEEFVETAQPYDVQITLLTPFAGSALHARLLAEGRLFEPAPWGHCTLFDVTFRPAQMTAEELRNGFRRLAQRLYSPEATARCRARFESQLRARMAGDRRRAASTVQAATVAAERHVAP